jgi:TusA-related sulfurtransferase
MSEAVIEVDCRNENCPMPLVKTRQAILRAHPGDVVEVTGTHPQSFEEIPLALEAMRKQIVAKDRAPGGEWTIRFRV